MTLNTYLGFSFKSLKERSVSNHFKLKNQEVDNISY